MSESVEPDADDLVKATRELTDKVDRLTDRLEVTTQQQRRTRILIIVAVILSVAAIIEGAFIIRLLNENRNNQVTNCQNANESRVASDKLWNFVVDLQLKQREDTITPEQEMGLERVRNWINQLYAPRDCSNLSRKYPLPDPPPVLSLIDKK